MKKYSYKVTNKEINKRNVLKIIRNNNLISRADISKLLKISRPTANSYINELLAENKILEKGYKNSTSKGGKRAILLKYNDNYKYIFVIRISKKEIIFAITNLGFKIIKKDNFIIGDNFYFEDAIVIIENKILKMINDLNLNIEDFLGIGIGSPGLIDSNGIIRLLTSFQNWKDINIKKILEKKINLPVFIDNECRVRALAENHIGLGKDLSRFACMQISDGVGAGIVINNDVLEDRNGIAGELGHFIIDSKSKIKCTCGSYGCLELFCSTTILINTIKDKLKKKYSTNKLVYKGNLKIEEICKAFHEGDKVVVKEVEKNAFYASIGISNLIKLFNPEKIIIYGDIECFDEPYLKMLKKNVENETFPEFLQKYDIQFSNLDSDKGLIGESIMVYNKIYGYGGRFISEAFLVKI